MAHRRNRDIVIPLNSNYRFDTQGIRTLETTRTNANSRWTRDDRSDGPSRFRQNYDASTSSKIIDLARPKLELLRANSPTLKRLLAARTKLEKYANSMARITSMSRQSTRSTREPPQPPVQSKPSQPVSNNPVVPSNTAPVVSTTEFQTTSTTSSGPLDKITYEKTWTNTGNIKQKCSLEIWLPKANVDEDDEDYATTRSISRESQLTDKKMNGHSRRSSINKGQQLPIAGKSETNPLNEQTTKKNETLRTRVYHYTDYIMDPSDERPRSSKSVTTVKSDGTGSVKSVRRHQGRSQGRRQSVSTNQSEEILRFSTTEVPIRAKNSSNGSRGNRAHGDRKTSAKTNPSMITELMQKYSLIKKTHNEMVQARLQLEKPTSEARFGGPSMKGDSSAFRPPPVPESTIVVVPDHSPVSVKKLLDTNVTRSAIEFTTNNGKLLDRRGTPRKPHPDSYTQNRIVPIANQHRQTTTSASVSAVLPTVVDFPNQSFNSGKGSTRFTSQYESSSTNFTQYSFQNGLGSIDQNPSRFSRRSMVTMRQQQQNKQESTPIAQLVHNPGQRFHNISTNRQMPTNKVFVQFNARNHRRTNRQVLVPD